ncbi:unnamed protein product [Clonostachys solani]|uniref:Uncharacterized protein n=1 Tax=Clonostachys solani TaxID=160281 RepID=A0A9N9ZCP9_9HYPO|nr:unnamed protein product [Clonostachys solani]
MSLNTLPLEITQQIVGDAAPDGFESIALTCKSLFRDCQPLINDYNRKRRRFWSFRYSRHSADVACDVHGDKSTCDRLHHWDDVTATTGFKVTDIFDLLALVLRDPSIGRFIHSLDLKHHRVLLPFGHRPLANRNADNIRGPYPEFGEEDEANIRRFLSDPVFGEDFLEDPSTYNLDRMSIVEAEIWLLNFLPNVKDIALSKAWAYTIPPSRLKQLEAIAQRANDPKKTEASLSQLTVMKPFVGHGYISTAPLSQLTSFLTLNSLQEFYMGGIEAWGTNLAENYFTANSFGTGLTKIELNGSCIGIPELSELLGLTPNLRSLCLGLESKPNGSGRSYDIGHIISIIGSRVGDVIEELAIVNHPLQWHTTSPASMSAFQRLRRFEIDIRSLWAGPTFQGEGSFQQGSGWVPLPLVDILPPSLETAKIYSQNITGEGEVVANISNLLLGFRDERHSKLPRLVDVDLISPHPGRTPRGSRLFDALRLATEAGLRVHHDESRQCQPTFTWTFNSRFMVNDAERDNRLDTSHM